MKLTEIIPDPLNKAEVLLCGGVIRKYEKMESDEFKVLTSKIFADDGVLAEELGCRVVFGDYGLWQVLKKWSEEGYDWLRVTSGWANGLTIRMCLSPYLSDKSFNKITVKDVKENRKHPLTPPIQFSYLLGWQQIVSNAIKNAKEKDNLQEAQRLYKMQENFEDATVGELLELGGAPDFWQLLADQEPIGQTTSGGFPGVEYDHGFILSLTKPEFAEGKSPISLCNATAGRSFAGPALTYAMAGLHHPEKTVKKLYIDDAKLKAKRIEKAGKTPPYPVDKVDKFADGFVHSLGAVLDDMKESAGKYTSREASGIQYAMMIDVYKLLSASTSPFAPVIPHCYMRVEEGWEKVTI